MRKTNIYQLITNLNEEESKTFIAWLKNRKENKSVQIFKILQQEFSKKPEAIEKEKLFQKIYPKEVYNNGKLRYTFFSLIKKFKLFAAFQNLEQNELEIEKNWIDWLSHRNLFDLREKYFKKYKNDYGDGEYIKWSGKITHYEIIMRDIEFRLVNGNIPSKEKVDLASKIVEDHLLSEIMRWKIFLKNISITYNINTPFSLGKEAKKLIDSTDKNNEVLNLIKLCIQVVDTHCSEEIFHEFSDTLEQLHSKVDNELCYSFYVAKTNYIIRKYNKTSNKEYLVQLFENIKERETKKYNIRFNILPYWSYRNTVSIALEAGEIKWAENYNNKFKSFVPIEFRENSHQLNLAKITYFKGNLEQSLEIFRDIKIDHDHTYLAIKKFMVQIYFELNELIVLKSLIQNTLRNLYRKKNQTYHWTAWIHFFQLMNKLIKIVQKDDLEKKNQFLEEIENKEKVANRKWLLEKVNAL